jgi:hypothetical protein
VQSELAVEIKDRQTRVGLNKGRILTFIEKCVIHYQIARSKGRIRVPKLLMDFGSQVAGKCIMYLGRTLFHRLEHVEDGRKLFVIHLNKTKRFLRRGLINGC